MKSICVGYWQHAGCQSDMSRGAVSSLAQPDLPCLSWASQHILYSPVCDAPCRSKLLQFGFWRVMLDEAQLVAASSSAAAVMCSSLWRRHAWVVSGTPVNRGKAEEVQVSCLKAKP